jgi:hypothetical protein
MDEILETTRDIVVRLSPRGGSVGRSPRGGGSPRNDGSSAGAVVVETFYCLVCLENCALADVSRASSCSEQDKHVYCRSCLDHWCSTQITDGVIEVCVAAVWGRPCWPCGLVGRPASQPESRATSHSSSASASFSATAAIYMKSLDCRCAAIITVLNVSCVCVFGMCICSSYAYRFTARATSVVVVHSLILR